MTSQQQRKWRAKKDGATHGRQLLSSLLLLTWLSAEGAGLCVVSPLEVAMAVLLTGDDVTAALPSDEDKNYFLVDRQNFDESVI